MSENISREQFEATKRDWDLSYIEGVIDSFRSRHVYTIENSDGKELDFEKDFPPELQNGFEAFLKSRHAPILLDVGGAKDA